jgi:hypothetical protein
MGGQQMIGNEEGIKTEFLGMLREAPDPIWILGIIGRQEVRVKEDPNLQASLVPKTAPPTRSKGNRFPHASMVLDTCQ